MIYSKCVQGVDNPVLGTAIAVQVPTAQATVRSLDDGIQNKELVT